VIVEERSDWHALRYTIVASMSETVVVVHAGAGGLSQDLRERETACRAAIEAALESAATALRDGQDAVAAVRCAVIELESFPLFNAGYGSTLCADGSVELSAALMRGSDRAAGAVAAVKRTRHPIVGAQALLEAEQVLMIGEHADDYAAAHGAEQWEPEMFVTDRQRRRLQEHLAGLERLERGTVGAVCLDPDGVLAAATSTGGRIAQPPGRVGDTPLIGAGTWADGRVAVSCTGEGEAFIRAGAGRLLGALVEHGDAPEVAARTVLEEVRRCGGHGGLIAVDARGQVVMPFSTQAMPRGVWRGVSARGKVAARGDVFIPPVGQGDDAHGAG
jgi:L-asparaginase / beta-aspartyl-peptidase